VGYDASTVSVSRDVFSGITLSLSSSQANVITDNAAANML
jgi:hypothetical protein